MKNEIFLFKKTKIKQELQGFFQSIEKIHEKLKTLITINYKSSTSISLSSHNKSLKFPSLISYVFRFINLCKKFYILKIINQLIFLYELTNTKSQL